MSEYENPWFRVLKSDHYFFVDEPKARNAAVVFLEKDGRLALVEQFRPASGCSLLEVPRGYGEAGETSLDCAIREAYEETGYKADRGSMVLLGRVRPNSAILTSCVDVYFGRIAAQAAGRHGPTEVDRCVLLTYEELEQKIAANEITDGFTLSGYLLLRLNRERPAPASGTQDASRS